MSSRPAATFRGTTEAGQHWVLEMINDQDIESPRESQENLGTLIYSHRRYVLGDERITEGSMTDYLESRGLDPNTVVSLPVYLYDHSGLSMSTKPFSCPWDSGCVGAIFTTFDKIDEAYGSHDEETLEKVRDSLRAEVKEMNDYLSGEGYGMRAYQVQGPAGSDEEDDLVEGAEEIDVWGFLGSDPRTNGMTDNLPADVVQALSADITSQCGRLPSVEPAPVVDTPTPAAPKAPRLR